MLCQVNFFGLLDEYKKLLMLLRSPQSPKRRRRVVSAALSDAFALSLAKVCHYHHLGDVLLQGLIKKTFYGFFSKISQFYFFFGKIGLTVTNDELIKRSEGEA